MMKLEIGCGNRPTPGYLHQDITVQENVKLDFICNPWEINLPTGSFSEVIALAVIEHLRFEEVKKTLKHVYYLLEEGGAFLFDVPDMKVWSEYLYNMLHGMSEKNPFPDIHIWNTFYGWQRWEGDEHKSGWSKETILKEVIGAGYTSFEEGSQIFTSIGIHRGRFDRTGDAHIYMKAIK
jgi:predicted SAM-dependent methyltransferase